jgi:hypothetical protein
MMLRLVVKWITKLLFRVYGTSLRHKIREEEALKESKKLGSLQK